MISNYKFVFKNMFVTTKNVNKKCQSLLSRSKRMNKWQMKRNCLHFCLILGMKKVKRLSQNKCAHERFIFSDFDFVVFDSWFRCLMDEFVAKAKRKNWLRSIGRQHEMMKVVRDNISMKLIKLKFHWKSQKRQIEARENRWRTFSLCSLASMRNICHKIFRAIKIKRHLFVFMSTKLDSK